MVIVWAYFDPIPHACMSRTFTHLIFSAISCENTYGVGIEDGRYVSR